MPSMDRCPDDTGCVPLDRDRRCHTDATAKAVSTEELLKTFQNETMKQKMIVQKAKICETRLLFAVSAVRQLFQDDHFVTLLRAEGLDSLPQYLAGQIEGSEARS